MKKNEEELQLNEASLYKNYGKTSDSEIIELLNRIILLHKTHKGVGTIYGYYRLSEEKMGRIISKPRKMYLYEVNGSLHNFDEKNDVGDLVAELEEYKIIYFIAKYSFCSWPREDHGVNIGEIIDQMSEEDKKITKAIYADFPGWPVNVVNPVVRNGKEEDNSAFTAILFK